MAVPLRTDSGGAAGRPRKLFSPAEPPDDITPDGKFFVFTQAWSDPESDSQTEPARPPEIIVVQNWFEELKRLVPRD